MRLALIILGSVAVLAALEAVYFTLRWFGDRRSAEMRRRLRAVGRDAQLDSVLLRRGRLAASPSLARILRALPGATRLEALLEQADAPLTAAQIIVWSVAAAAAALVGAMVLRLSVAGLALLPVVAAAIPTGALLVRRARRSRRLSEQLPEALDMMARSLRAGHALPASFQVVAGEMPQPISIEFARAFEEQKLGLSLEQAVVHMSARAPANGDLKIFAVSTVIQRETGGNLAEILDQIATTIRERYKFFGKVQALTAEGRVSGLILGLLPIGVAILVSMTNPSYLARLVDNPTGHAILVFAVVSWLAGVTWLNRLAKVDL
jgi:tight adherence protein B